MTCLSRCKSRILLDNFIILLQMRLVCSELGRVVVGAEGVESGGGVFEEAHLMRVQDVVKYAKDIAGEDREVARTFLNKSLEDL